MSFLIKIALLFIIISFFKRLITGSSAKPVENAKDGKRVDTDNMNVKDASFSEIDEDS